jgi:hypothetical protein
VVVSLSALALFGTTACSGEKWTPLADEDDDDEIANVSEAAAPSKFSGAWCEEGDYDIYPPTGKPWLTPTGWTMCHRFTAAIKPIAPSKFSYNLRPPNAKPNWENTMDRLSMETVDIAFGYLHGGISASTADYGLWKDGVSDFNQRALTANMQFGNEGSGGQRGLSILATYSCLTLSHDANLWTRWINPFRGGLRMALGSHALVPFGPVADDVGKTLGESLAAGALVRESWRRALASVPISAPGIVMASGTSAADCSTRRDTMTWANFNTMPRVRDSKVKNLCWMKWE